MHFDVSEDISSDTDVDYFTFGFSTVPASIGVSLTNLPSNYDLALYGPDRSLIASSTRAGTLSESISATAFVTGSYYIKVFSPSATFNENPYTLRVTVIEPTPTPTTTPTNTPTPTPSVTPTPTATPTATNTPTDPYEPNDSYAQAYLLTSGQVVNGRIHSASDIDFFKVYVSKPGSTVSIMLTDLPADYDLYLDKPDQTSAAASVNSGTQSEYITYAVGSRTGHYYLVVLSAAGQFSATPYTLQVMVTGTSPTPGRAIS